MEIFHQLVDQRKQKNEIKEMSGFHDMLPSKQTESHTLWNKGGGYLGRVPKDLILLSRALLVLYQDVSFVEAEQFIESDTRHLSMQPVSYGYG